jgi:carbonic anhydrase/acetyltransferase-like protein (isoleucine patch superfamily)
VGNNAEVSGCVIRNSIISEGARVQGMLLDNSIIGNGSVLTGSFKRINIGGESEIEFF